MAAVICGCVLLGGAAGCSQQRTDATHGSQSGGSSRQQEGASGSTGDITSVYQSTGAKKADSLNAYIDQILSYPETTAYAREILERAKTSGGVSLSDYQKTWSRYKTCMLGKGYKEIILVTYPNGAIAEAGMSAPNVTDAQDKKHTTDMNACMADVGPVAEVYDTQIGNPGLLTNPHEAIVDCMKREGVAPRDYTVEQYNKLDASGKTKDGSVNLKDMKVRGCQVANNSFNVYPDDVHEHPFG